MRNKIMVLGDSITYGAWDKKLGGWVNRMRLSLDRDPRIKSAHVFNLGISGQTTTEILARMDDECRPRAQEDANLVIIIAAGINDARLHNGTVEVPEEEFRSNYRQMTAIARKYTSNVICVGLTRVYERKTNPVWWDKTMCWTNSLVGRYDEIIREVCEETGTEYVQTSDLVKPRTNADGLHPSSSGHRVIAAAVGKALRRRIRP